MSKDLNQCNFIGRIGKDIDLKYLPSGKAVANFSIACGDDYKKEGQKVEQTNWINVVAFGRTAEVIGEYCSKGSRLFVSGKQVTRKWEDKDGNPHYTTEINTNNIQLLDSKPTTQQQTNCPDNFPQGQAQGAPAADDFGDMDQSIPF